MAPRDPKQLSLIYVRENRAQTYIVHFIRLVFDYDEVAFQKPTLCLVRPAQSKFNSQLMSFRSLSQTFENNRITKIEPILVGIQ